MTRYYYTLEAGALVSLTANSNWKNWLTGVGITKTMTSFGFTDLTWFSDYIAPRFHDSIITYIDKEDWEEEPTNQEISEAIKNTAYKIFSFITETTGKYEYLLNKYNDEEENFLKAIGTKQVSKFNDTPQDNDSAQGPEFNTNITTVINENDVGTILARIEEVRQLARNVYADWADEFERRFVIRG